MRLINTETLLLGDETFGGGIPKYAILSHAWAKEEVSFQEWLEPTATTKSKAGYIKLRDACAVAFQKGHNWLWADTVCIDKTSSAELSEAINSMYAWYRNSVECLVYLVDVEYTANDKRQSSEYPAYDKPPPSLDQFIASRWFTHGWTLQELLAPPQLTFYDRSWQHLGSKSEYVDAITLATGITRLDLRVNSIHDVPIARRMSWIAD